MGNILVRVDAAESTDAASPYRPARIRTQRANSALADDLREMPCEDYHQFNVFVQGSPTSLDGLTVDIINTDEGPDDYSSYGFGSWKHVWKCKDVRVAIKSAFYQGMNRL
ncbi:MAG: hypothetical protein CL569_14790 [Alphaproteobacteria bacterium]|nr:hypothetical protein [Alphaproteobacteria bacterium]|tara:strand:+ start:6716 stop:7045 length:330 start_codon:yes stop_codon:yes gene_type:complete